MFSLHDIVRLKKERLDIGVKAEHTGTIIDFVKTDNIYSVEFFDENGETIEESIYTYFLPDELELITEFKDIAN